MTEEIERREFLRRGWKVGAALIAAAGAMTSWDILRPLPGSGFGGIARTVPYSQVPTDSTTYVRAAQTYLTRIGDEVVALWQRCPHLGCRVAWCESSGEFDCPCHGSRFSRAGDHRAGPAPRGLDRFAVEVVDDVVLVDTGTRTKGPPPGTESLDEPTRGPGCGQA